MGVLYLVLVLLFNTLCPSCFAIILMGKRAGWFALIFFLMPCDNVLWLFLLMPWVGLLCVIVVFPDHTHLLFSVYILSCISLIFPSRFCVVDVIVILCYLFIYISCFCDEQHQCLHLNVSFNGYDMLTVFCVCCRMGM